MAIDGFVGLTLIDCSTAAVIVSTAVFEVIPFWVAVMLVEPVAKAVASPVFRPTVATLVTDEFQVAEVVRSWVLLSE